MFDSFVRLPGDGRSPDRLLLRFPFRKFSRWWRMNGCRRRLSLLHRISVDGGGCGTLVLFLDPRNLVVLAGLSRHRGRYLSHLYLCVKKSLMARILRRSATLHHGVIAIEPRSIPFVICNPEHSFALEGLRSRVFVCASRSIRRAIYWSREIRTCI